MSEDVEAAVERRRRNFERREKFSVVFYPLFAMFVLLVVWEVCTLVFSIPEFLLPKPTVVFQSIQQNAALILRESWVTAAEIALGYLLSIAVGVPLALAIFLWPFFARSIYPILIATQAMPKVAVAPLLIVWFGFGMLPKVLIAFLIAFFPIVINTVMGLTSIEKEKIYLARAMGLGTIDTFFKIRLPNAMPSIFGGLKISITLAVVGAVVGEFVGGNAGLGYQLIVANGAMDTPMLFALLFGLTLLGIGMFLLVELAERLIVPRQMIGAGGGREMI
ncbi:ABC transporter permease [Ferrovibrio sp.]|uniref:ABC transporter permease n=1 Tax=Ferrovibrio sp. TaxID=1917215 RepID=UPI003D276D34